MFSERLWVVVSGGIQVQREGQGMSLLLWIQREVKKQIVPKTLKGVKKEILLTLFSSPWAGDSHKVVCWNCSGNLGEIQAAKFSFLFFFSIKKTNKIFTFPSLKSGLISSYPDFSWLWR